MYDVVHHPEQRIEGWLDSFGSLDGCATVQDLLQYHHIGCQSFATGDELFEAALSAILVGMVGTDTRDWAT